MRDWPAHSQNFGWASSPLGVRNSNAAAGRCADQEPGEDGEDGGAPDAPPNLRHRQAGVNDAHPLGTPETGRAV